MRVRLRWPDSGERSLPPHRDDADAVVDGFFNCWYPSLRARDIHSIESLKREIRLLSNSPEIIVIGFDLVSRRRVVNDKHVEPRCPSRDWLLQQHCCPIRVVPRDDDAPEYLILVEVLGAVCTPHAIVHLFEEIPNGCLSSEQPAQPNPIQEGAMRVRGYEPQEIWPKQPRGNVRYQISQRTGGHRVELTTTPMFRVRPRTSV